MTKQTTQDTQRREIFTNAAELKIREADGEKSREIEGYAILFNTPSAVLGRTKDGTEWREVIDPEAISDELLNRSDILMTLFHNNEAILARSKNGQGTLSYWRDEKGVGFRFTAPDTVDGDKAVELVRTGDLSGCSFAFSTRYGDPAHVERSIEEAEGKKQGTFRVKKILGLYDFTLTPSPAYPATSVSNRELLEIQPGEDPEKDAPEPPEDVRSTPPPSLMKRIHSLRHCNRH